MLQPSETQLLLMTQLAATLAASSSPAVLEIRILANYGNDGRFDFLRKEGKWRGEWEAIRDGDKSGTGIETMGMGLVEYPDSEEEEASVEVVAPSPVECEVESIPEDDEIVQRQMAKAAKAKEWAEQRRKNRATQSTDASAGSEEAQE